MFSKERYKDGTLILSTDPCNLADNLPTGSALTDDDLQ